jgi:hypothetical protein
LPRPSRRQWRLRRNDWQRSSEPKTPACQARGTPAGRVRMMPFSMPPGSIGGSRRCPSIGVTLPVLSHRVDPPLPGHRPLTSRSSGRRSCAAADDVRNHYSFCALGSDLAAGCRAICAAVVEMRRMRRRRNERFAEFGGPPRDVPGLGPCYNLIVQTGTDTTNCCWVNVLMDVAAPLMPCSLERSGVR